MTREEIDQLVARFAGKEGMDYNYESWVTSQYDDRSSEINYSLVRKRKPKVVVEFGARTGKCTHDILKALFKNGGEFTLKSYELEDDYRKTAQQNLDRIFGDKSITIGGDVTKATDIPDGIDYLFLDNYHDEETTDWVFNTLFKKLKPGALVQIHDLPLTADFEKGKKDGVFPETDYIIELYKEGKLPLEKLYFTFSEGNGWESTWWTYKPL